jgi:hypothetical protein
LKQCRLLNDPLTRWSLMPNEFDYEVEHIREKDNVVADTLSRFPPDVDAAVTRNVNLPIVGATLPRNSSSQPCLCLPGWMS